MTLRHPLHADARTTLARWTPPDDQQRSLRDRYLAHLDAHPDGVWRSCRPDHLTAGVLVLSPDGERVLLTLHARAGRWFQFGGHLEDGDLTLAGAALREATEESGVEALRIHPVPVHLDEHEVGFCGEPGTVHHLDVRFVAVAPLDAAYAVSEESHDVRWWPAGALPDSTPEMVRLVELAKERTQSSSSSLS